MSNVLSDGEKLIAKIGQWKREDHDMASKRGEQRAEIKQVLEDNELNGKAVTWIRQLDKMSEQKRADTIDSLKHLLGIFEPHWEGQSTKEMDLKK